MDTSEWGLQVRVDGAFTRKTNRVSLALRGPRIRRHSIPTTVKSIQAAGESREEAEEEEVVAAVVVLAWVDLHPCHR